MSGLIVPNDGLKLGLRFTRSSARVLRNIAASVRNAELRGVDVELYDKAAECAANGEPLIVHCSEAAEVEQMADAFTPLGVKRPMIEELSGEKNPGGGPPA